MDQTEFHHFKHGNVHLAREILFRDIKAVDTRRQMLPGSVVQSGHYQLISFIVFDRF